jgi:hypothetical protein
MSDVPRAYTPTQVRLIVGGPLLAMLLASLDQVSEG